MILSNNFYRFLQAGFLVFFSIFSQWVIAHAVVVDSSPKQGEILQNAPKIAILHFNSRIEQGLTHLELISQNGRMVTPLQASWDKNSPADQLMIPLNELSDDHYILHYTVLSADGHRTSGELRFSVKIKINLP